jgi:hypothetical protein
LSHASTRRFSPPISQWQISLHKQVYEFAVDRFPDFALLRLSLAVELIKAGQVEDAKRCAAISC